MWPLLRRDALARFFALGMLLSLVPICATYPHNRLLFWSSFGAMGLIARFLSAYLERDAELLSDSSIYRIVAAPLALALVIVHLLVAPVQTPIAIAGSNALRDQLYISPISEPNLTDQSVVIVNGPLVFFASHFPVMQASEGRTVPMHTHILAPSFAGVEIERPDERTIVVRPRGGYLAHPLDLLYRSLKRPMSVGDRLELPDVSIEVASLTTDGRPASITCRFTTPLEAPSLRWIFWEKGRYKSWTPPAPGGKVTLPPAIPLR